MGHVPDMVVGRATPCVQIVGKPQRVGAVDLQGVDEVTEFEHEKGVGAVLVDILAEEALDKFRIEPRVVLGLWQGDDLAQTVQAELVALIDIVVQGSAGMKKLHPAVVVVYEEDAVVIAVVQLAVVDQGAEPAVEVHMQGVFVLDGLRRGCHDCQEQHDYGQESTGDDCQQRCSGVAVRRSRAVGRGGNNDAFHSARV